MSNTNAPFGFQPFVAGAGGSAPNYATVWRKAAYNGGALYKGDAIKSLSTGYVGALTASGALSPFGIAVGFKYLSTTLGRTVWSTYYPNSAATGDVEVELIPCFADSEMLFKVQTKDTPVTFQDIGATIDIYAGSGSSTGGYGKSGMSVAYGTLGTNYASSGPFTVRGLLSQYVHSGPGVTGIDDTSNYNIIIVSANAGNMTGI